MLKEGPKLLHWNYFLALESDLDRVSRYVEFTTDNYTTYSLEMAHLLLAAGSEIDVVLKGLCKKVNPTIKASNIENYREILTPKFPKLCSMNVRIPRYNLGIIPWDNWQNNKKPCWWDAYNKVKHERNKYYYKANLQYTIESLAGLFTSVLYLYQEEAENGSLVSLPKLMSPTPECIGNLRKTKYGVTIVYKL